MAKSKFDRYVMQVYIRISVTAGKAKQCGGFSRLDVGTTSYSHWSRNEQECCTKISSACSE